MNIFFLDRDIETCAKYHCDKHVVKMIVEYAQLLSTALRFYGVENEKLYKSTHVNHPSAVWVRTSRKNFNWVEELLYFCLKEYTYRYGKKHKTWGVFPLFEYYSTLIPDGEFTEPPACVAEDCLREDVVESYRLYYNNHKVKFATWKQREMPDWFVGVNK